MQEQHCPLCESPAKFKFVDACNRKHFFCPHCSNFQISKRAEILVASSQELRKQYSDMARAGNNGKILIIRLAKGDHKGVDAATTVLTGEFVSRTK